MRRLGKHTTYEFQTHVELDAPSVMCSWYNRVIKVIQFLPVYIITL